MDPKLSSKEWEAIFDTVEVPMMVLDKENRIIRINKMMKNFRSIDEDVVGEKCFNIIHKTSKPPDFCPHAKTILENVKCTSAVEFPELNSYLLVTTSPLYDFKGNLTGSAHIAQDITKQKEAEKKIRKLLELRELLLKETHHRVKNNLITISSLLSLQARYVENQMAKEALLDSKNRAQSMAIIHQILYSYSDYEKVDLNHYFKQLLDDILKTYSSDNEVGYFLNVNCIDLKADTALVLGLILNEFVSNSLKHAFSGDSHGIIKVDFEEVDDKYILKYSDDGKSVPKNFDLENVESFGLTIVNLLINQLDGQISVERDKGTCFTISFEP